MYTIRNYIDSAGKDVLFEWQRKLRDSIAKMSIDRRIYRLEHGNFGDHKFCRDGVWELRVDVGAGYRVYYAVEGNDIILLLCAGDKRTQDTDISRACDYWRDWQRRV
jgi:putative addiction module killer protein